MEDDYLQISGIQHFCFCRRQWALIHIENCWTENELTAEGRVIHERAHSVNLSTVRDGIISVRGLSIKSERLKITGICDVVELIPDINGISLFGRGGTWRIHPIEYKRGKPKENDCDRLQLTAECICLEEMLSCQINKAALYYDTIRRREEVLITEELRLKLEKMVSEMQGYYQRRYTPRVKLKKHCNNCSLIDICLPKLSEKTGSVSAYISKHIHEEME